VLLERVEGLIYRRPPGRKEVVKRSLAGRDLSSTSKPNDAWGEIIKQSLLVDLNITNRSELFNGAWVSRWEKDRTIILPDCHLNDDTAHP